MAKPVKNWCKTCMYDDVAECFNGCDGYGTKQKGCRMYDHKKNREKVVIDVIAFEDSGENFFQVFVEDGRRWHNSPKLPPFCVDTSGFFSDSGDLDNWLEDHRCEVDVVHDWRVE